MQNKKDVVGYEGLYYANVDGFVFSYKRNKQLKSRVTKKGYGKIALSKNNIKRNFFTHRIIAMTFLPNNDTGKQINHINGIKMDNRVENLEWVTPKENTQHAHKNGLAGNNNPFIFNNPSKRGSHNHSRARKIYSIDKLGNKNYWLCVVYASKALGIRRQIISEILQGKKKEINGYSFYYM